MTVAHNPKHSRPDEVGLAQTISELADHHLLTTSPLSDDRPTLFRWTAGQMMVQNAAEHAAYDVLHYHERLLRYGWGFIMSPNDDTPQPVVSQPVRIQQSPNKKTDYFIYAAGDPVITPHLHDTPFHDELIREIEAHNLTYRAERDPNWIRALTEALPFPVNVVHTEPGTPDTNGSTHFVSIGAVYLHRRSHPAPTADRIKQWSTTPHLDGTALNALYNNSEPAPIEQSHDISAPITSLPLNKEQTHAVLTARENPVSVISGAPGCGKSHALAAIAHDAVARRQSVLIATRTSYAADILADLLSRYPGPRPIQFGDSERRGRFLTQLGDDTFAHAVDLREAYRVMKEQQRLTERVAVEIEQRLDAERSYLRHREEPTPELDRFPYLRAAEEETVEYFTRQLDKLDVRPQGRWEKWKQRRLRKRVGDKLGNPDLGGLRRALAQARDQIAHRHLTEGLHAELTQLVAQYQYAHRRRIEANSDYLNTRSNVPGSILDSIATALTGPNRETRAQALKTIRPQELTDTAPLWIGTVHDVDDILPHRPALFDLVILDEANHLAQPHAVGALGRAHHAVIAGDAQQLPHTHGPDVPGVLDLADDQGPTTRLTQHQRSHPHLIDFPSRTFYGGDVKPVTAHPRLHQRSAITVHTTTSAPSQDGVNHAEIDRALTLVAELIAADTPSTALITPYPEQARALESRLVTQFDLDSLHKNRIRCGTVPSFQGCEVDTVIALFTVTDDDTAERKAQLAEPHQFNVMTTRARRHMHVITSQRSPEGLVGDYLAHAAHTADPAADDGGHPTEQWIKEISERLRHSAITVRTDYRLGRHTIDLVAGDGEQALAVTCLPHREGTRSHLQRHQVITDNHWRHMNALPSTFDHDPVRAAAAVIDRLETDY
ncbi:DEAD/DEAH box helicase [Haloglycomyces albus]|uniref:DEAD/DEAH box helicase n=1 Tax=Haloglycomyces albus TaxID=526067 RepID=UPI00046CE9CC|nr:AAA domain-containing protein [Haloglycomyces albus]